MIKIIEKLTRRLTANWRFRNLHSETKKGGITAAPVIVIVIVIV